jgi:hypothetical protein
VVDHTGSSTPHLLAQEGKASVAYLLNRDDLGGMVADPALRAAGWFYELYKLWNRLASGATSRRR